jgi:hypothetical protein
MPAFYTTITSYVVKRIFECTLLLLFPCIIHVAQYVSGCIELALVRKTRHKYVTIQLSMRTQDSHPFMNAVHG